MHLKYLIMYLVGWMQRRCDTLGKRFDYIGAQIMRPEHFSPLLRGCSVLGFHFATQITQQPSFIIVNSGRITTEGSFGVPRIGSGGGTTPGREAGRPGPPPIGHFGVEYVPRH